MISEKLNLKKLNKKSYEIQKHMEQISINKEKIDPKYIENPLKQFVKLKTGPEHHEFMYDLISIGMNDDINLDLINSIKFLFLNIEAYRFKNILSSVKNKDAVLKFINRVESCKLNPNDDAVESIFKTYKKHLTRRFGDIDSWEFVKVIKEGQKLIDQVIEDLKKKVEQSEDYFIESVQYNRLKNRFILYYLLDYYRPSIDEILRPLIKEMNTEMNFLHSDSLDQLSLNKLVKYKRMFQEQKDKIVPPQFYEKLGFEQNDMLFLMNKQIELLNMISFDIIFMNIKEDFTLRRNSRIGLASVLYDFFLITHRVHPVYEFYTEEEWWDEQDTKGNLPSNRKWKNHKLLRVRNIVPEF